MNFQPFTVGTRVYTAAEQAAAWNSYISQDSYLSGAAASTPSATACCCR